MAALAALLVNNAQIADWQIEWLMEKLHQDNEVTLRQRAAHLLSEAPLTNNQARDLVDRSAHDILEAILYPSATFVREFETYKITTKEGEYTGVIHEKSPDWVRLAVSPQNTMNIMQKDILKVEVMETSMMPQGLDQVLSEQEMADLMAFLLGQDQDPELDQKFLR